MIDIMMLVLKLRLANLCLDGVNKCTHFLDFLVCKQQSIQHLIFRNFLCASLDHNDLLSGAANGDVHQALLALLQRRVQHELAVYQTNVYTCYGVVERNIRNSNCDRCTIQSSYLRGVVVIVSHNGAHDGYVIAQILREQRTHRTVDLTGSDGSLLACLALTAHKGARDTAYCVQLFFKINGKREEIHALTRLRGSGSGNKNYGIAVANQSGTICQLCNLAGLNSQLAACERGLKHARFIK